MAKKKKHCVGLKRNGKLKKGFKWRRGGHCPVKAAHG